MKLTAIALAGFLAALAGEPSAGLGRGTIYVPLFTYRTGPFSGPASRSPTACTIIWRC